MTIEDPATTDPLTIGGRAFSSRLFLGTGKFPSNESLAGAIAASGTEVVLALVRADYVTGQVMVVDGGLGLR